MSGLSTESTNGGSRRKYRFFTGGMFLYENQRSITMPPKNSREIILGNDFMTIPLEPDKEIEMDK